MKTTTDFKMRPFEVHIPNLDGDGIAETIRIEVPVRIDPESGEEILTPEAHELIEKTKARRMGLMSPDEIRELRERFDLTQEEMSGLLQIGAKTYTRWESGRARLSRSMNVILSALRDGVVTVEYLRSLRDGRDWTPLLNRRLEKSIVFFSESSAGPKFSSTFWGQAGAAVQAARTSQPELQFGENVKRRNYGRRAVFVCDSLSAWVESAQAA